MRAGHYYRMLQSGPWGVSDPIWGFLSLLAKDAEHYYHAINTFISINMITNTVSVYPWIGLLVVLLKNPKSKLKKAVSDNLKLCTHIYPKNFHRRKYSECSKEAKSKNCV